jgi:glycosyltransferase involved in cell wall biosynthesis
MANSGRRAEALTLDGGRVRVLMVTPRYLPQVGGVEIHVAEVAKRIASRGLDVTVLTTDVTGKLPACESRAGVVIRRVRAWPRNSDYYFAPQIWRAVKADDWSIVHCQGYHSLVAPLAMLAAAKAKLPYVVTFHSGGHSSRVRSSLRAAQQLTLRPLLERAKRLIAVSQFEADLFARRLRLPASKFVVIPNGAELPRITSSPATCKDLIVSVGRLERYKGHQKLLAALPLILRERPEARVILLGSGPYERALRNLAISLGIDAHIDIRSVPAADRDGMATFVSSAALVVLLSSYEAHPIAVMEALALHRPVLVSLNSGLKEFVDRGLARGVPPNASTHDVARAVLAQLERPLIPQAIELPTWDRCAEDVMRVYSAALGG